MTDNPKPVVSDVEPSAIKNSKSPGDSSECARASGSGESMRGVIKSIPCAAVCAILFALCSFTEAQERGKIYRIGFLYAGNPLTVAGRLKAFREGLIERGYIEGKNLVVDIRYGEGRSERLPALAAELVQRKVDVIVTAGPTDTQAAKTATNTLSIVMAQDSDPVASGFVASLARPGGNITGIVYPLPADQR